MKNFVNLMTDQAFWDSVKTTLILTAFNVIFVNVFGVLIAVWMDKKEKTYNLCKAVIFIPCVLSSVVVSFIWSYMTQGNGGVINEIIGFFGGTNVDFFASPLVTTLTVTMAISWAGLGFYAVSYTHLDSLAEDFCGFRGSFLSGLYDHIFHLPCGRKWLGDDGYPGLG